jgi:hypothetical protein
MPESFWTRGDVHNQLALMSHSRVVHVSVPAQATYAYSVIPGGVRNVADLREHAARDYVVRQHFAAFNYGRAHLVRAGKGRAVYVSFRQRDRIFWTRKKVRLLEAELLVTDGAITARARCGNQVSDTPKEAVSEEEPAADVLDQPVAEIAALGPVLPFHIPSVQPDLPSANSTTPDGPQLFAGGFHFPYVDFSIPVPKLCKPGEELKNKRCRPHRRPPALPEPSTWLLIASGLFAIAWQRRRKSQKSTAT